MSKRRWHWVGLVAAAVASSVALWGAPAGAATTWRIVAMPQPAAAGGHQLSSISCPTSTFCMAVGTTASNAGAGGADHAQIPLAETFDGSHWTLRHPATPPSSTLTELFGVSCPSARDCTAVGVTGRGNIATAPFAESWNGKTWRTETAADPSGSTAVSDLFSVSCPTPSSCVAVGTTERSTTVPLAETWRSGGVGWKVTTTPAPGPKGAKVHSDALFSVACPAATRCVAVGGESSQSGGVAVESDLVEEWNGQAWSAPAVPSSAAGSSLFGVSCASTTSCVAGGQTDIDHNDDGLAMSLVLSGSRWAVRTTPHLKGERLDDLVGVSCAGPSSCSAVGLESGARTGVLAEHWSGKSWSVQRAPDPGQGSALDSVACNDHSHCVAVGSYGKSVATAFSEVSPI